MQSIKLWGPINCGYCCLMKFHRTYWFPIFHTIHSCLICWVQIRTLMAPLGFPFAIKLSHFPFEFSMHELFHLALQRCHDNPELEQRRLSWNILTLCIYWKILSSKTTCLKRIKGYTYNSVSLPSIVSELSKLHASVMAAMLLIRSAWLTTLVGSHFRFHVLLSWLKQACPRITPDQNSIKMAVLVCLFLCSCTGLHMLHTYVCCLMLHTYFLFIMSRKCAQSLPRHPAHI